METLLVKSKRKKRKTRKCLDELRKKSRDCFFNNLASVQSNSNFGKNFSIPSNFMKCNMFTKAIRSETITRSVFPNNKVANFSKNVHTESQKSRTNATDNDTIAPIVHHHEHTNQISQELSNNCIYTTDGESSDRLILFRPRTENNKFANSGLEEARIMSANSPSESLENYGYHLYEELMNAIPKYIERNFSNLIKDDNIIKETRESLQNLSMNYSHHKLKNKMYNTAARDIKETIVENPMDYLRLGCMLQANHYRHEEKLTSKESSPTSDCLYLPSVENLQSILTNTPEYDFFPHKLNL